jgi:hypothetical protein
MYAQTDNRTFSSWASTARPTRATLRTRPREQRILIRSWEYIQPVRVTVLVIRLLVVLWLVVLGVGLIAGGYDWGGALIPAALIVLRVSFWVFSTAAKGWPAVDA